MHWVLYLCPSNWEQSLLLTLLIKSTDTSMTHQILMNEIFKLEVFTDVHCIIWWEQNDIPLFNSEDFMPVPNSSQGTVGWHGGLCDPPRICLLRPSLTHHQTGPAGLCYRIIMFTTASPDSFTPVTWAQCEPALICEQQVAPMVDLPIRLLSPLNAKIRFLANLDWNQMALMKSEQS